jgi:4-amino-4-deoxy-L-arabinose transferase-like glycosyltransferase
VPAGPGFARGQAKLPPARRGRELLRRSGYFVSQTWPLLAILAVQARLSLSLVWSNTAFTDEALYLQSGHLEIEHWLHGTAIPAFATYFSGAPVLYPPLGAMADSIGGLAAARILSLCFMLCATSLLWAAASRIYDRMVGFFAAGIFAILGPTLRLGAFATFDAMSLCLIALSAYCVVRAARQERAAGWLVAGAVTLAAANATKYASALFDPVVAGILIILASQMTPWRRALAKGCLLMGYAAGILVFLFSLGGGDYATGIEQTTLERANSDDQVSSVFSVSWRLIAIVFILSCSAVLLSLIIDRNLSQVLLLALLAAAAALAPLEQARIHTLTSLNKHVDFGSWFAAMAAGYLIGRLVQLFRTRLLTWAVATACTIALFFPARTGLIQARVMFASWPNSSALVAALHEVLPNTAGPILFDDNRAVPQYYLPTVGAQWYRWSNDSSLRLPDGKSISVGVGRNPSPTLYADRVESGYFSVVVLNYGAAAALDSYVLPALKANPHYHLQATVPYGGHRSQIWVYEPQTSFRLEKLGPPESNHSTLIILLAPVARLRPILSIIEAAVVGSGIAVIVLTFLIRYAWRRGKAFDEI